MNSKYDIKEITEKEAKAILDSQRTPGDKYTPEGLFFIRGKDAIIGIDNLYGNAWTEEFKDLATCKIWLEGTMTVEEAEEVARRVRDDGEDNRFRDKKSTRKKAPKRVFYNRMQKRANKNRASTIRRNSDIQKLGQATDKRIRNKNQQKRLFKGQ